MIEVIEKNKAECYGVFLTHIQEMKLMKYLNHHSISMNTKQLEERKEIVRSFLTAQKEEAKDE